ncbi:7-cyano-7-deazaguanine synthase QueC [Calditrichota bacterium]
MEKAVILLSGGIDSSTTLYEARLMGFELYALTVKYGQRHAVELDAAKRVAKAAGVTRHVIMDLDLRAIGGSALTDEIEVPHRSAILRQKNEIPVTYVPARNSIFLTLAASLAESIEARHIFIGVNAIDYSGYPDCRLEFISAFEKMINLGTKAGVEGKGFAIETPLIEMTKAEIIRYGVELGVDFSLTHSCYDPNQEGISCGECESCLIRLSGFREADLEDPLQYSNKS